MSDTARATARLEKLAGLITAAPTYFSLHGIWGKSSREAHLSFATDLRSILSAPPPAAVGWRPEVRAFADLMEAKLLVNDHKGGWKNCTPQQMRVRLREEVAELEGAIDQNMRSVWSTERPQYAWASGYLVREIDGVTEYASPDQTKTFQPREQGSLDHIGREAADVANFAMMIADVCGALPAAQSPSPAVGWQTMDSAQFVHHTRHPWAQPGDRPDRIWILRFDDTDVRDMVWTHENAETEAKAAYRQYCPSWNCYLFTTIPSSELALPAAPSNPQTRGETA